MLFRSALGRAVIEETKSLQPVQAAALRIRSLRIPLPLEPLPPVDEAQRRLLAERDRLSNILGRGEDKAEVTRRRLMVDSASQLVQMASQAQGAPSLELEVQGIALGRAALIGLSAEPFAEYEKLLLQLSPFPHTFPISCANGNIGYLPTASAFAEGGYEIETAPYLHGVLRLRPEVESVIHQAFARLLVELAE